MNDTNLTNAVPVSVYNYEAALNCYNEYCVEKNVTLPALPYPVPETDDQKNTNAFQMVKNIVINENGGIKANALDPNQRKFYPWFKKCASGSGLSYGDYAYWTTSSRVPACLCSLDSANVPKIANRFLPIYDILQN